MPRQRHVYGQAALAARQAAEAPATPAVGVEAREPGAAEAVADASTAEAPQGHSEAPEPATPKRQRAGQAKDQRPADWWVERFLARYSESGNKSRAAKATGVTPKIVRALEASDPAFAANVEEARLAFLDNLEEELVRLSKEKSQPVAAIARLRAELPHKYSDRAQVEATVRSLNLNATAVLSPTAANDLLRLMLADATDATKAALAAAPSLVALPAAEVVEAVTS